MSRARCLFSLSSFGLAVSRGIWIACINSTDLERSINGFSCGQLVFTGVQLLDMSLVFLYSGKHRCILDVPQDDNGCARRRPIAELFRQEAAKANAEVGCGRKQYDGRAGIDATTYQAIPSKRRSSLCFGADVPCHRHCVAGACRQAEARKRSTFCSCRGLGSVRLRPRFDRCSEQSRLSAKEGCRSASEAYPADGGCIRGQARIAR